MNPRDTKVSLAQEIVARFHSQQVARDALASFEARFRDGIIPDEMPEVQLGAAPLGILKVLREAGLVSSGSEAQRNVEKEMGRASCRERVCQYGEISGVDGI